MITTSRKAAYRLMAAKEYNQAMARYAMSPVAFARLIGVSWRQGERYRNGDSNIPDSVAKLIRTIHRNQLEPEDVG
jgi:DNA-binding transcriptional regulator YiaG